MSQPEIDIEAWCGATQGTCKGGRLYGLSIHHFVFHKDETSSGLHCVPYDGHSDFITLK